MLHFGTILRKIAPEIKTPISTAPIAQSVRVEDS